MIRIKMEQQLEVQQESKKVIRLEDLQDLQLPIVEVNRRTELVIGVDQNLGVHRRYLTLQRSNGKIILRRYDHDPDGKISLKVIDETITRMIPCYSGHRLSKISNPQYEFFNKKLKERGS